MSRSSTAQLVTALLGGGLAGACVATQARANGALAEEIGSGYVAAVISFAIALAVLALALPFTPAGRRGFSRVLAQLRSGTLPWWALLGGACGAYIVIVQGLSTAALGLALYTVGIVAGQVFGGYVLDRVGLGTGARLRATPQRLIGMALAVIAIVVSTVSEHGGGVTVSWLLILPFVGGLLVALQSALNGRLRLAARSAYSATVISYIVGAALVSVAAAITLIPEGLPAELPPNLWLYSGGVVGPIFIVLMAVFVRTAGVLLLGMALIAGQLVASVMFELVLPFSDGLTIPLVIGSALAFVAVVVAAMPSRRARPEARVVEDARAR